MRKSTLLLLLLAVHLPLRAETRSCRSEWLDGEVSTEVIVRLRLDGEMPMGLAIETFVSWSLGEDSGNQVFSAYVNTDSPANETITIDDDPGARRFRLHPDDYDVDDDTRVRVRRRGPDYVVDVDSVSRYHRGMAPFPRRAVVGVDGGDCQATMFDP